MPAELNITDTAIVLESSSEPGPAGPGVPAGGTTGQVLVKSSNTDYDTEWDTGGGGGGGAPTDATYIVQTANGDLSAEQALGALATGLLKNTTTTGVLSIAVAGTDYQAVDSDLTAIAALTTTAFGRGLLTLADQAALLSAAGAAAASHAHAGEDITSGTVADARIASTIARDSEVTSAVAALSTVYQPLDSDLTAIAALTTTTYGRALLTQADEAAFKATVNLEAGTDFPSLTVFNDHSARHEDGGADEISLTGLSGTPADLQAHLDDTSAAHAASAISADSTTLVGTGTTVQAVFEELDNGIADHLADTSAAHAASAISFSPTGTIAATDVQAAIAEVASEAGGSAYPYVLVKDERTANTNGGSSSTGSWQTRTIQTESVDASSICAISSNQITLAAGTYRCRGWAAIIGGAQCKNRLRNVTDGTTVAVGNSEYCGTGAGVGTTYSPFESTFTVGSSKALELQSQVASAKATDGYGIATNYGEVEVFAAIEFWKIA
jgi:hypothetical protein